MPRPTRKTNLPLTVGANQSRSRTLRILRSCQLFRNKNPMLFILTLLEIKSALNWHCSRCFWVMWFLRQKSFCFLTGCVLFSHQVQDHGQQTRALLHNLLKNICTRRKVCCLLHANDDDDDEGRAGSVGRQ